MSASSWGEKFIELAKLANSDRFHKRGALHLTIREFLFLGLGASLGIACFMIQLLIAFARWDSFSNMVYYFLDACAAGWINALIISALICFWAYIVVFTFRFLWLCYKYDGSAWPVFRDLEQHEEEWIANLKKAGKQYRKRRDKEESKSKKKLEKQIERIRSIGCQQTDPTD